MLTKHNYIRYYDPTHIRSLTQPHGQFELHQPAECVRHVICLGKCNRSTVKASIRREGFVGNVFSGSSSILKSGITVESFTAVIFIKT
jgi:hypothetical protein